MRGDGPPERGNDGVVRFTSASIDGVESQKVVQPSGHSVQMTQPGIQELRRILLRHAGVEEEASERAGEERAAGRDLTQRSQPGGTSLRRAASSKSSIALCTSTSSDRSSSQRVISTPRSRPRRSRVMMASMPS